MIKRNKRNKKVHNQGNSYIMVVATLSFLAVLTATMLVAVALCYRLKAYDINARDNFYYLEQAMDEIYAGVGADSMKHLNDAYDDTIEVLVYFDPLTQSYVTMDDEQANTILKNTFITLVKKDENYKDLTKLHTRLKSFMSNNYNKTSNPEGVLLTVDSIAASADEVVLKNVVLKREATYSTINTRKTKNADGTVTAAAGDTFVQTITTDLVIGKPEFDVNFNTIESSLSDLYGFAFIADKGIEIGDASKIVNITGNIYAAADYYNKDYNLTDTQKAGSDEHKHMVADDDAKAKYAAISNYTDAQNKACNGKTEKSMYSGLYINGADVNISADKVIVPGSIAAFNGASVTVFGPSDSGATNTSVTSTLTAAADIWTDGIVLGGYSFLTTPTEENKYKTKQGAIVNLRANAYVYDDLEVNAEASKFNMVGRYFGYNYASVDNRTYTDEFIQASTNRTFLSDIDPEIQDGRTLTGQAHYNSSSIIVNGQDSSLDLSGVTDMYIAGQAYIETSKKTTKISKDAENNEYKVVNKDGENEAVSYNVYDYEGKTSETVQVEEKIPVLDANGNPKKDAAGNIIYETEKNAAGETVYKTRTVDKVVEDNYTTNTTIVDNKKNLPDNPSAAQTAAASSTNIQDYRTGEAISIKSNQLAYIPNWLVNDTEDGLYLTLPDNLQDKELFTQFWDDKDEFVNTVARIPIIKTVVSGKEYYFFDFSTSATTNANNGMNYFIEMYASLFDVSAGEEITDPDTQISDGEAMGLTNIKDYDHFKIEMLKVTSQSNDDGSPVETASGNYANIYSNSAISVKNGTSFTIKAKSSSQSPLDTITALINADIDEKNLYGAGEDKLSTLSAGGGTSSTESTTEGTTEGTTENSTTTSATDSDLALQAANITSKLLSQYKEVKWTLSDASHDAVAVNDAHTMAESDITPINYFFKYNMINDNFYKKMKSGYRVWISDEDVQITTDTGSDGKKNPNVKGLVICKGNVTFASDVKSFEGLIVTGSKVAITDSINFTANEEIIKTILREADESQMYSDDDISTNDDENVFYICQLFNHYESYYESTSSSTNGKIESAKSISAVQFEDILSFNNWKKNVD